MSKFSIIFDPATDNLEVVQAQVGQMFGIFGALVPGATVGATAGDSDTAGDTASTATHDNTGLPWDARIHADPRSITTKGVFRAKRGVDKQLVAQVEAELRAAIAGTAGAGVATGAALPIPGAAPAPLTLAAPTPLTLPSVTPPAPPTAYEQLVLLVGANMAPAGPISEQWLRDSLTAYHVAGGELQNVAALTPQAQSDILAAFKQALNIA